MTHDVHAPASPIAKTKENRVQGNFTKSTRLLQTVQKKSSFTVCHGFSRLQQDKLFRRKYLSTGANFVHVYIEIWDKGTLKFNKFSM